MGTFNAKTFNSEVFLKYMETIPASKIARIIKSGILKVNQDLAQTLVDQVGGNFITKPMKARLSGTPVLYDGATDITSDTLGTFSQGIIVIGRAKGFTEKDFTEEITGHDFMSDVANQLVEYWDNVNEGLLLSTLKGIFASALASNVYDCADKIGVTSLNDATTKVSGDKKEHFKLVFMHSDVANDLANANLLTYLMYNNDKGLQVPSDLAYWGNKLVIVTDQCPTEKIYALTSDDDVVAGKTYYTRSGSAGAYVYTPVANPVKTDIGTYYEFLYTEYTSYAAGVGAFEYCNCPVKVPVEMARDAADDGGVDYLYSRERIIFAPFGVSFVTTNMSSTTPTDAELETGSNWALVKNTSNVSIDTKVIPLCAIKSRSVASN